MLHVGLSCADKGCPALLFLRAVDWKNVVLAEAYDCQLQVNGTWTLVVALTQDV